MHSKEDFSMPCRSSRTMYSLNIHSNNHNLALSHLMRRTESIARGICYVEHVFQLQSRGLAFCGGEKL